MAATAFATQGQHDADVFGRAAREDAGFGGHISFVLGGLRRNGMALGIGARPTAELRGHSKVHLGDERVGHHCAHLLAQDLGEMIHVAHASQGQAGFLQSWVAADAVREMPLFVTALPQLVTQLAGNLAPIGVSEEVPRDGGASSGGGESDQGPDPGARRPRLSVVQNLHECQNRNQGQNWKQGGDNAARPQHQAT